MIAYIDGGARGNPGAAGFGVYLEDDDGREVDSLYGYLGERTNNVAEYAGLLAALRYAVENGVRRLAFRSDSELLVKQINGSYRVRNPGLQRLHRQARLLMSRLERVTVEHVRREKNLDADRLANMAMDTRGQRPEGVAEGILDSL
jgi:ribonuclease HI